ncbi:MAG TPA: sigma factor-like helix-turn-helix DNA-binding protein, partial [Gemmataceae bacterium]|nr:sigma factor-like helix-turn-helix DNA-binding protein [Gemmataceae bacterium]
KAASLGSWLHGTAHRCALQIRRQSARRRDHERKAITMPRRTPSDETAWRELHAVLDEELLRLPEKYRAPFVLCCQEDRSKTEAARELGWPEGTVAGRLARARRLLQQRLARRGITLSVFLAALALGRGVSAVPPRLAVATARAATCVAVGQGAAGIVSDGVEIAVRAVVRGTAVSRGKVVLGLLLMLTLLAPGVGLLRPPAAKSEALAQVNTAVPKPGTAEPRPRLDRHGDPLPAGAIARLGTVRLRHGQWVRSVAFSPDGKLLASASADRTIRLWDRVSGRELHRMIGHKGSANFVLFTPDGKHLISAGGERRSPTDDASVRLWDVASGWEVRHIIPHERGAELISALSLSPDGKTLARGWQDRVVLTDLHGAVKATCEMKNGLIRRARFSPDGKTLAAVFEFVGVCLFDARTGRLLWKNTEQPTNVPRSEAVFAPDGRTLAVTTAVAKPMRLLDAATGKEVRRFQGTNEGAAPLLFSADGKRLFSSAWGKPSAIWDVTTGKEIGQLTPPGNHPLDLALSADGKLLASGSDRSIRLWDATTGNTLPTPDGAHAWIDTLALSPDGKSLITSAMFDPTAIRVWDLATGRQTATLTGANHVRAIAYAPDGKTFAAGAYQGAPVIADAITGKVLRRCQGKAELTDLVAFSPDGKLLVGAGWDETTLRVWDPLTGKELPPLGTLPNNGGAKCLAFSPDGKLLATGGMDQVVRLWDVAARKEVRQLIGQQGSVWGVAFSPDGRTLAGVTAAGGQIFSARGADRTIRLWDVNTGKVLRRLEGPPPGSWCVAWSPDGRMLATGGDDGLVRLWELATCRERARLAGHEGPVTCLKFTHDGRRMISGSSDTTVLVWDLTRPLPPPVREKE